MRILSFLKKNLTTVCFLLLIGVFFSQSLKPFAEGTQHFFQDLQKGETVDFSRVDTYYNDNLPFKNELVTLNGGWQRLLGRRSVNDRYKLDNGQLTYVTPEADVSEAAAKTVALAQAVKEQNIPFVYVSTPFKIAPGDKQLPFGIEDYSNENADRFLEILRQAGVATLDLREAIAEDGLDHYSLFFNTDHHWKAEAGFWAAGKIQEYLEEREPELAVDDRTLDIAQYDQTVLEQVMLGSAGKRVGKLYGGMDDLTIITPKFDTSLEFLAPEQEMERRGNYAETMLFPEQLEAPPMTAFPYTVYTGGDYGLLQVRNLSREGKLEVQDNGKKLLVVKDSFSCVIIPFLSLGYEECRYVDMRLFGQDLPAYIGQYQPDAVLVIYNPGVFEAHNANMFQFAKE